MTLGQIYQRAVESGKEKDPRGMECIAGELKERGKDFEGLKDKEKAFFDKESLTNPYSDTRILHGEPDREVGSVLVGIDIEVAEILLADRLKSGGRPVDAVIAHHPEGMAYARLADVMKIQADILGRYGVPINVAESLTEERMQEVDRKIMPANHTRSQDAARLLDIPFLCIHTPADNMVTTCLQSLFDERKPLTLDDVVDLLMEHEEYRDAAATGTGPCIFVGSEKRKAGRIFVDMTGGTEGSKDIYERLCAGGVNTIVGMHLSEEHRKEAEKHHLNVVIAGHISSDNLGMNLLFDRIFEGQDVGILECSGYRRIKRA